MMVYMARTNIDIDEELVRMVMERYSLPSKREAVDFALREVVGGVMTKQQALAMRGFGWDGDLEEIRGVVKIEEWSSDDAATS
jgi:Arc/MetJ family transcription regulator